MRAGRVKNVLFLADRVALVNQAAGAYREYLPETSRCNLCSNKDEHDARIVFSTYQTILNAIDSVRNADGVRMYTPAHFDLIIVDEAHRSIFKKYRAIFEYFDALIVGLTATPANEVDRNTYDFFEVERGVPTYVYGYMDLAALTQPPFDRPQSFVRMFTTEQQKGLVGIINQIKANAEEPAA